MVKKADTGFTPEEIEAIIRYRSNPNRRMIEFAQYFEDLDELRLASLGSMQRSIFDYESKTRDARRLRSSNT